MSNRKRSANDEEEPLRNVVSTNGERQPATEQSIKQWTPNEFLTETEAYAEFGHVLEDKELRYARYSGRIGFMRRKRTIFYRRDELSAFVEAILKQDYIEACPIIPEPSMSHARQRAQSSGSRRESERELTAERRQRVLRMSG